MRLLARSLLRDLLLLLGLLVVPAGLASCELTPVPPVEPVEQESLSIPGTSGVPTPSGQSEARDAPPYLPLDHEEGGEVWEIVGLVEEGGWVIIRWGRDLQSVDLGSEVIYVNSAGEQIGTGAVVESWGALLDAGVIHGPGQTVSVGDRVFVVPRKS